jgi:hypothetical protein
VLYYQRRDVGGDSLSAFPGIFGGMPDIQGKMGGQAAQSAQDVSSQIHDYKMQGGVGSDEDEGKMDVDVLESL